MWQVNQILIAIGLDLLLGDPHGWPHVTRGAGVLASYYEKKLTKRYQPTISLGAIFWVLVTSSILGLFWLTDRVLRRIRLGWALHILIIYQSIALTDLRKHIEALVEPLARQKHAVARRMLARIVGRDTNHLNEAEICRAAIECIAESLTDGIVGPIFWAIAAGAPAALMYRTANTLDSVVGYRSSKYEYFGKFSARADDVLSWFPARLVAAAFYITGLPVNRRTVHKESHKHASPNAGLAECVMAYRLGVRLGGDNVYQGERVTGPVFNAGGRYPRLEDISVSLVWMQLITTICVAMLLIVKLAIINLYARRIKAHTP
ncbi:MAG: cobalamin biosynthesis protein CobD [Verrucomicrobia bacterium]|nr:cobalamin biosynthesis protein CobD [Verrucomicrobiota bacterium]